MRINHLWVQSVFNGKVLQLLCNATGGYPFPKAIEEQVTAFSFVGRKPFLSFILKFLWDKEPTNLATFCVNVVVAHIDMFHFQLYQFANSCTIYLFDFFGVKQVYSTPTSSWLNIFIVILDVKHYTFANTSFG